MMSTRFILALLFSAALVLTWMPGAYSMQSVNSLLSGYNVSAPLIGSLTPVALSYSSNSYLALYKGGALYFVVNVTGPSYAIVTNTSRIAAIITGRTINTSLSQANFPALVAQMKKFQASSAGPINDCLTETGLSTGATCTLANYCNSCQTIPNCASALASTNGPSGILAVGIMQFASQYAWLNGSFSQFYLALSSVSSNNVASKLTLMNAAFMNISNLTQVIYKNSLFLVPSNYSQSVFSSCNPGMLPSSQPWYCTTLGYCMNPTYNYTKLAYMTSTVGMINSLPITNSQIMAIASNASSTEMSYISTVLSGQRRAQLSAMLNRTAPGYAALVGNANNLLSAVPNSILLNALNAFRAAYANVTSNYLTINLTAAGGVLAAGYANLTAAYKGVNATYSAVTSGAANSTARLIELQLGSGATSQQIGNLAFAQFRIDAAISSGNFTNITALSATSAAVSKGVSSYFVLPIDFVDIARRIDGPFITLMSSALGLSYSSAVSLAPTLGALLSLIIGAAALCLLFFYRSRLRAHHKVVLSRRIRRNWNMMFALIALAVVVYVLLTASLLSYANASAQVSDFRSALGSSKSIVLAVNGTQTRAIQSCLGKIQARMAAEGKSVIPATISGGVCAAENITGSADSCMGTYAKRGIPVVTLTNSTVPAIGVYSLYGTRLYASGNNAVMGSCYFSSLIG